MDGRFALKWLNERSKNMTNSLDRLLSIASAPICEQTIGPFREPLFTDSRSLSRQLKDILRRKNGFYAFETALHFFPHSADEKAMSLEKWNEDGLWKGEYDGDLKSITFFAEDLFGGQFGIEHSRIIKFDPESCEIQEFAENFNAWSLRILNDHDFETGYSLAVEWHRTHGPITPGKRLLPKIPFVLGGEFTIQNLYEVNSVKGMRFRADLCRQIKNLPNGTDIELKVIE